MDNACLLRPCAKSHLRCLVMSFNGIFTSYVIYALLILRSVYHGWTSLCTARHVTCFTLMDGNAIGTPTEKRRHGCLYLMLSDKIQNLMRKTRRIRRGRNTEFYAINVTSIAQQPVELYIGEELTTEQRNSFRALIYADFLENLQPLDSPHVSRQWDNPIETTGSMGRHRLCYK
jgi:hypothetical protein